MGAVNYFTSDYITMGVDIPTIEEFNTLYYGINNDIPKTDYNSVAIDIECIFDEVKEELERHNFYYYHIAIKPGYYEGFTLDIENNFPVALDNWQERKEANKEITEIKQFLINCAGLGLVKCSPGWCTGYADYNGTIKAIKEAIKEMRTELKTVPTWAQYNRGGITA